MRTRDADSISNYIPTLPGQVPAAAVAFGVAEEKEKRGVKHREHGGHREEKGENYLSEANCLCVLCVLRGHDIFRLPKLYSREHKNWFMVDCSWLIVFMVNWVKEDSLSSHGVPCRGAFLLTSLYPVPRGV